MGVTPPVEAAVSAARGLTERAACRRLRAIAYQVPASRAIVELGAYQGRTTGWLALGAARGHGAHVTAIDPWDRIDPDAVDDTYATVEPAYRDGRYTTAFDAFAAHATSARLWGHVTPLRGTAASVAAWWVQPVGLLFHDAVHTADAVDADLRAWAPHVAEGGAVALHDLGNPHFGVEAGAARVLTTAAGWDWAGRERLLWAKDPARRGLLVVWRRRP